jgi:hypothetical protein
MQSSRFVVIYTAKIWRHRPSTIIGDLMCINPEVLLLFSCLMGLCIIAGIVTLAIDIVKPGMVPVDIPWLCAMAFIFCLAIYALIAEMWCGFQEVFPK